MLWKKHGMNLKWAPKGCFVLPSGELTYPNLGKGKRSSNVPGIGEHVSCREGTTSIKTFVKFILSYLPCHPRRLGQLKKPKPINQRWCLRTKLQEKNKFTLVDCFVDRSGWLIWLCNLVRCKKGMLLSCLHLFLCQKVEAWDFYPRKQVALHFHQLSPQNQPARCLKKNDTFLDFPGNCIFFEVWFNVFIPRWEFFPKKNHRLHGEVLIQNLCDRLLGGMMIIPTCLRLWRIKSYDTLSLKLVPVQLMFRF